MDKLLSIIIPSYNMEKYLPKCLDSLLLPDQELLQKLDVIVVNDGSKDRTSKIAREYERKHPGIYRVIDKPNGNYGSCVNRGVQEAQGIYCKICDADDWYDTNALMTLIKQVERLQTESPNVDVVITNFNEVDQSGFILHSWRYPFDNGTVFGLDELISSKATMSMHAVALKTDHLRRIGYHQTEGISYTDTEWYYRPIALASKIFFCECHLYSYLIGREGQTVARDSLIAHDSMLFDVLARMINEVDAIERMGDSARNYAFSQIARMIAFMARAEAESAAVDHAVHALRRMGRVIAPYASELRIHQIGFELKTLLKCMAFHIPLSVACLAIVMARKSLAKRRG